MDMIKAPVLKTLMLRKNELKFINSITEIGVFSLFIGDSKTGQIYLNEVDGLLPRTKQADCDEGGVNAGFAVVDNLLIVDADPSELKPTVSGECTLCTKLDQDRMKVDAIETCSALGLMVKMNEIRGHPCYIHAPVSLYPVPIPQK
jgi:hypothetical protein